MNIDNLQKRHFSMMENYTISSLQTLYLAEESMKSLLDFPNNLSEKRQKIIKEDTLKTMEVMHLINKKNLNDEYDDLSIVKEINTITNEIEKNTKDVDDAVKLIARLTLLSKAFSAKERKLDYFNFELTIYTQTYVMLFGYFEANITNTIEIICLANPKIIEKYLNMNIKYKVKKNENELLKNYIPRVLEKIGQALVKRIQFLEKTCNLTFDFREGLLNIIKITEQIRHIIIHRNGKIDRKFLDKSGFGKDFGFKIGDYFLINREILRIFYPAWHEFVTVISNKVYNKYLKNPE